MKSAAKKTTNKKSVKKVIKKKPKITFTPKEVEKLIERHSRFSHTLAQQAIARCILPVFQKTQFALERLINTSSNTNLFSDSFEKDFIKELLKEIKRMIFTMYFKDWEGNETDSPLSEIKEYQTEKEIIDKFEELLKEHLEELPEELQKLLDSNKS